LAAGEDVSASDDLLMVVRGWWWPDMPRPRWYEVEWGVTGDGAARPTIGCGVVGEVHGHDM
jgi:hypothetical protein